MGIKNFNIHDLIYGRVTIDTPVISEIINTPSFQRLKSLNQYGIPDEFYHKKNYSRYEHCLGVMLLLKHFKAQEEEQIAGLLHDISHHTFSHVYDWVVGSAGLEDAQDHIHYQFLRKSEIPKILKKYGYSIKNLTNYHNYGLLERESPELCADRIDYSLRELEPDIARKIFKNLTVVEGQIVCKNQKTAATFARKFLALQTKHWGEYEGVARYHLFAGALKEALKKKIINQEDFWREDKYVVNKLKASKDNEILKSLAYLRQKPLSRVKNGVIVRKKFRFIDPLFINGKELINISAVDKKFVELLKRAKEKNEKGVLVPK